MYTFFVKRPVYTHLNRTQVFRSWKPGSANTLIGQRIGRFQFTQEIHLDDNASLYQGLDIEINSPVVIKLFSPEISQDKKFATQFKSGFRQAKSITADGLVPLLESGMSTAGQLYFVTDYVNGISLQQWVYPDEQVIEWQYKFSDALTKQQEIADQRDAMSTVMSLRFAEQIGQQLALFEAHNLPHQSLSLTKYVVQPDEALMLLGYGLPAIPIAAKANGSIHTLAYTAPEQATGVATTIQSNIYSLGVMLYEMLAGSRPLIKEKRRINAHASESTWRVQLTDVKADLSDATYGLVDSCLHSQPWNRFASVAELQAAISTALQIETAVAEPFLNQADTQTTPIVVSAQTAVPITPAQPEIKPIQKKRTPKPMPDALSKAAILPQTTVYDESEEDEDRPIALIIFPIVAVLLFLIAGGIFFFNQANGQKVGDGSVIAAVSNEDGVDPINAPADLTTNDAPTLQIIGPEKNAGYQLSDSIIFQVRWPQPLAEGEELILRIQKNTWGSGTSIGSLMAVAGENDLYEIILVTNDISNSVGTFWWQILRDADGNASKVGVPLSELRPINIIAFVATATQPALTPSATATPAPTPEVIACVPDENWVPHIIQQGDTISGLGQKTRTTVEQILEGNCLEAPFILSIGHTILLPTRIATPTSTPTATLLPSVTPTQITPTSPPSVGNPTAVPATTIPPTATIPPVLSTATVPPEPTRKPPDGPTATVPPPPPTATFTPTPIPPTIPPVPTNTPVPPTPTPMNTPEPTEEPPAISTDTPIPSP